MKVNQDTYPINFGMKVKRVQITGTLPAQRVQKLIELDNGKNVFIDVNKWNGKQSSKIIRLYDQAMNLIRQKFIVYNQRGLKTNKIDVKL